MYPRHDEAVVAEEQPVLVDEAPDRGNVFLRVHDRQFGTRQPVYQLQDSGVLQIAGLADNFGKVVGDEQCGVAVFLIVRIGSEPDDAVVCDAALAVQVQRFHVLASI